MKRYFELNKFKKDCSDFMPFKYLGDMLKENNFVLKNKTTHRHESHVKKSDEEIFREAMVNVKQIREFIDIPYLSKKPRKYISLKEDDTIKTLKKIVSGQQKINLPDTPEYIEWVHSDIRKDITQKLHQGYFSVQDYIDLHGLTVNEAEIALSAFLKNAIKKRLCCVKVIHGRGLRSPKGPVLKESLVKWLHGKFSKWIIAYSTAKDRDGGLGATYIILKTRL
ncbi:MAG: Smr/MutS family protein [Nitrospirae bacterium]|nr:Smr/MutS family protein [Nitrospirota bacterium]